MFQRHSCSWYESINVSTMMSVQTILAVFFAVFSIAVVDSVDAISSAMMRNFVYTFLVTRREVRNSMHLPPIIRTIKLNQIFMWQFVVVFVSPCEKHRSGGETALKHRGVINESFCWDDVFETDQKHRPNQLNKNRGPTFLNMMFSLVGKQGEDVFSTGKRIVIKSPTNVWLDVFLVSP